MKSNFNPAMRNSNSSYFFIDHASSVRHQFLVLSGGLILLATIIATILARPSAARADDVAAKMSGPSCSTTISSCGCTITSPGFYEITAPLLSSQGLTPSGDCISIKASKAMVLFNDFDVTGPGGGTPTGVGVHLLPGASNDFIEFLGSSISGWDVGLLVEGNNNIAEDFYGANNNGTAGVELNKAKNNNINDFDANNNSNYGVWLKASSNNQINCSSFSGNTNAGVYVGCSASGPISAKCRGVGKSVGNQIYDFSTGGGKYGVALDTGSTKSLITDGGFFGHATIDDYFDANPGCDSNKWFGNAASATKSQGCIN
jgi:hypothetical protein